MGADTKIIQGLDGTLAMLKALDDQAPKVVAKANRAGAKVLLGFAKAIAPVLSGFLQSKLKIRTSNKKSKGIYTASVGIGAADFKGDEFYGAFVLWGHLVGARKLGSARKAVPPNDFITRTHDQVGELAADTVIEELDKGIQEVAGGK